MKRFDAHFHIIDYDYEIQENNGYWPPQYDIEEYRSATSDLEIAGGAIVSGSFQGFDQDYLIDALEHLGPRFVGVTQLPMSTTDEEIIRLNEQGVRALRFNVKRGGSESLENLEYFAQRVYDLVGWHSELYIDSQQLPDISPVIHRLPAISIDHLGLSEEGLPHLLDAVDHGVRVKATGFSRVDLDVAQAMRQIYEVSPDALMFGTDLPSTRAPRPFSVEDVHLIEDTFDAQACGKIFWGNAHEWYRIGR